MKGKRPRILERYGERVYSNIPSHNQLCDVVSCITISKSANSELVKALNTWIGKRKNLIVRTVGIL